MYMEPEQTEVNRKPAVVGGKQDETDMRSGNRLKETLFRYMKI